MNIAEKMKQDWDLRAQHHARFWIATENYQTEEVFSQSGQATAQALLETLAGLYQSSWRVLDIGCGIGRVLKPLAKYFRALVGIDVSSTMIAQSKSWLSNFPHIATFETTGVDLREFKDQSFDLVYSYVTFQHMPRPVFDQYLREINRVLSPDGYLAMQLPIGRYFDVPIEDTIGIRSYSYQEIEEKLFRNGLAFCTYWASPPESTSCNQPFDHRFHLIKKTNPITTAVNVNWVQLEHQHHVSPLEMHLYGTYADNCVKMGMPQDGINTLELLVQRNPHHLTGWLHLAALLLEAGQVEKALTTMQELTAIHPRYQEGQELLTRIQKSWQKIPKQDDFKKLAKKIETPEIFQQPGYS